MVDLKALMGDASDNIPGVPGIGEKTALDLVRRFGGVAEIYERLDTLDIKDGVRKKLEAGRESAKMSYTLATISREAPVELSPEDAAWKPDFGPELYGVLNRLGFRKFIEKWGLEPAPDVYKRQVIARGQVVYRDDHYLRAAAIFLERAAGVYYEVLGALAQRTRAVVDIEVLARLGNVRGKRAQRQGGQEQQDQ